MKCCKICNSELELIYHDTIREGSVNTQTKEKYEVYRCKNCGSIWHDNLKDADYYEGSEYRGQACAEQDSSIEHYWKMHDSEVLFKLQITGTGSFRNKIVADIGAGGGSFLDYVSNVAKEIIAIEPSKEYRDSLSKKYKTYAYTGDAIADGAKADIVTSFDVIEHVEDPISFIDEAYELLNVGGKMIIGTPTEYPLLRKMLGDLFDHFIFQVPHIWIFTEQSLKEMTKKYSNDDVKIRSINKFGIGNFIHWILEGKPRGDIKCDGIPEPIDALWRSEMPSNGNGEYLVLEITKH